MREWVDIHTCEGVVERGLILILGCNIVLFYFMTTFAKLVIMASYSIFNRFCNGDMYFSCASPAGHTATHLHTKDNNNKLSGPRLDKIH